FFLFIFSFTFKCLKLWFSSLSLNMFYHLNIQLNTLFSFLNLLGDKHRDIIIVEGGKTLVRSFFFF
ncbi:hypothetical protein ISN44_As11g001130, partial [Arabidopsis suecica]